MAKFILAASGTGENPRDVGAAAFSDIASLPEGEATALAGELFGQSGALRLTSGIQSGAVGLGQEQLSLANVLHLPNLAALAEGTNLQQFQGAVAGLGLQGGLLNSTVAGGAGLLSAVPGGLGDAVGAGIQALLGGGPGPGVGTIGSTEGSFAALLEYENDLAGLVAAVVAVVDETEFTGHGSRTSEAVVAAEQAEQLREDQRGRALLASAGIAAEQRGRLVEEISGLRGDLADGLSPEAIIRAVSEAISYTAGALVASGLEDFGE